MADVITYRDAVAEGLAREMRRESAVVCLGEDIGAAGGVFKTTVGLLVWLTLTGQTTLRRKREGLSEELLAGALGRKPPEQVGALLDALRALVQSVTPSPAAAGHSEGNPA